MPELTQDLFPSTVNKSEQLLSWCKKKGFFSTADIMQYAINNYYLRAKRTINDFVKENKVRIVSPDECLFRNLKGRMAWYEWIGHNGT